MIGPLAGIAFQIVVTVAAPESITVRQPATLTVRAEVRGPVAPTIHPPRFAPLSGIRVEESTRVDGGSISRAVVEHRYLVVAQRPGAPRPQSGLAASLLRERRCDDPARLARAPAGQVYVSPNTELDVSSSAVRAVIAAGRDPRYLMPEAARRIILATGSYARPGDEKE